MSSERVGAGPPLELLRRQRRRRGRHLWVVDKVADVVSGAVSAAAVLGMIVVLCGRLLDGGNLRRLGLGPRLIPVCRCMVVLSLIFRVGLVDVDTMDIVLY